MVRRFLLAVALLVVLAAQSPAQAQWGMGCGGYGLGGYGMNAYGYGMPVGWYTGVQGRMPPYFALHPPVYYSGQIVRIPYGASPFACPWGVCPGLPVGAPAAPVEAAPEPQGVNIQPMAELTVIENKFYKPDAARVSKQASEEHGLMIANPYYQADAELAVAE
jgi:hypothetical protein